MASARLLAEEASRHRPPRAFDVSGRGPAIVFDTARPGTGMCSTNPPAPHSFDMPALALD